MIPDSIRIRKNLCGSADVIAIDRSRFNPDYSASADAPLNEQVAYKRWVAGVIKFTHPVNVGTLGVYIFTRIWGTLGEYGHPRGHPNFFPERHLFGVERAVVRRISYVVPTFVYKALALSEF